MRSFDPTVSTKNRQRLLEHKIGQALFDEVVWKADRQGLLSDEHFSVDGTLIEAAASIKSFRRREEERQQPDDEPNNPSVDFRRERLKNETHESRTDPEARLMRKGKEAKLVFMGLSHNPPGSFRVSPYASLRRGRRHVPRAPR